MTQEFLRRRLPTASAGSGSFSLIGGRFGTTRFPIKYGHRVQLLPFPVRPELRGGSAGVLQHPVRRGLLESKDERFDQRREKRAGGLHPDEDHRLPMPNRFSSLGKGKAYRLPAWHD